MSSPHITTLGGAGWAGVEQTLKRYGLGNRPLKVPKMHDEDAAEVIVQFLQDDPYTAWRVHPVTEGYVKCLDDECPLCKANHKNIKGAGFNVLMMSNQGPEVRTLALTGREMENVQRWLSKYPREQWYFNLKRTEVGVTPFPVKPEEMEEDWGIAPPAAGYEVDSTALFTDSPAVTVSRREMAGLAAEIVDKREASRIKRSNTDVPNEPKVNSRAAKQDLLSAMEVTP